jgi:hypothetical protein
MPRLRREDREAAISAKLARQEAAGIPDSRLHRNPEAETPDLMLCHINGELIADLVATGRLDAGKVLFAMTDEGIEKRLKEKAGRPTARTTVIRDESDKRIFDAYAEGLADDKRYKGTPDPLGDLMRKHQRPGIRLCLMNDNACRNIGTQGYEPLLVNGRRVEFGDGWLGWKSEEAAQQMDREIAAVRKQQEEEISSPEAWNEKLDQRFYEEGVRPPKFSPNDPDRGSVDDNVAFG